MCKNGLNLFDQMCVTNTQCIAAGGQVEGKGLFGRVCGAAAHPGSSVSKKPAPLPTASASWTTCVGKKTADADESPCQCSTDCHTCAYDNSGDQGVAGYCTKCKNTQYELYGSCVSARTCAMHAGGVMEGRGKFGRRCGRNQVAVLITNRKNLEVDDAEGGEMLTLLSMLADRGIVIHVVAEAAGSMHGLGALHRSAGGGELVTLGGGGESSGQSSRNPVAVAEYFMHRTLCIAGDGDGVRAAARDLRFSSTPTTTATSTPTTTPTTTTQTTTQTTTTTDTSTQTTTPTTTTLTSTATTTQTTTELSTECTGRRTNTGARCECARSCWSCDFRWEYVDGSGGACKICKNGYGLFEGSLCLSPVACILQGCMLVGKGRFNRECICTTPTTTPTTTTTATSSLITTPTTSATTTTTVTTTPTTTTTMTTTEKSTSCLNGFTNTGAVCECSGNCRSCEFDWSWPIGSGTCYGCTHFFGMLTGWCISPEECADLNCRMIGAGPDDMVCDCTPPDTTPTTTPTTTTTGTTTVESTECVGRRTNTGADCTCASDCHACEFKWGYGGVGRWSGPGTCRTCKNGFTLYGGRCEDPGECTDAGCSVQGSGNFGRVCICTTPTTTATTTTATTTPTTASVQRVCTPVQNNPALLADIGPKLGYSLPSCEAAPAFLCAPGSLHNMILRFREEACPAYCGVCK